MKINFFLNKRIYIINNNKTKKKKKKKKLKYSTTIEKKWIKEKEITNIINKMILIR